MTLPLQDPQLAVEAEGQPSTRTGFFRTVLRERKAAVVGLSIIVFFVLLSILAPYISPYSITEQTCAVYAPPSSAHWLGCDDGGIDMLSELMQGGRISLIVGFAATLVAMIIGGGVGILSGYFGRATDIVLMRITDYLLVIPDLVLMIVIADVWGASLFHVIIVIGILEWTSTARIIRAQVMSVRERVYVKRTRALGAGNARVIFKHILPQVGPLLIANTVLTIAIAIYLETALAFLGLADPTVTSWGTILEHAFERTAISSGAWWAIVPAGLVIAAVIVGCFLFGQAVEDTLNPRLQSGQPVVAPVAAAPAGGQGAGRAVSLLEVEDLHVWFDLPGSADGGQGQVHAAAGVSFAMDEGERFGLVGESGCGKTTTILALMGLLPPTASLAGQVRVNGQNILAGGEDSVRAHRWTDIAMVFQGAMNALNPVKTDRLADRRADGVPRCRARRGGPQAGRRAAGDGRYLGRGGRAVPARVLRRHAAAGVHRHGPGLPAEDPAGRRADHRARRDGAGPDPGAAHPADPRAGAGPGAGHPRPAGGGPGVRPGRGDVRG